MPELIINGEKFEVAPGETVMDVARQHGSHLGFTCSQRGICTFCECKVEEGAELLNPVTGNEKARLSRERLEKGSRLACRAIIEAKEGTIRVITRPELVKSQLMGIVYGTSLESKQASLKALGGSVVQAATDYLGMYPYVFKGLAAGKAKPDILNPFKDLKNLLRDGGKVASRQLGIAKKPDFGSRPGRINNQSK